MSETDDQNREARISAISNADGSVAPAADLLPGHLTPEEQRDLEADFDGAWSADHAELRLPIETIEDFDRAMAELLSRTSTDVVSEARRLRDEESFVEDQARLKRYFAERRAEVDAEADRLLYLSDPTVPIDTEQVRMIESVDCCSWLRPACPPDSAERPSRCSSVAGAEGFMGQ